MAQPCLLWVGRQLHYDKVRFFPTFKQLDSSSKVVYASMAEKSGINVKAENKSVASQIIVHYSSGVCDFFFVNYKIH